MSFDVGTGIGAAGQGATIGTSIMPGWGTAIGAAVGFVAGGIMGGRQSKRDRRLRKLQEAYMAEMLEMARRMKAEGGAQFDLYNEYFKPIETILAKQAMTGKFYADESVRQDYMDRASANIIHAFNKQRQITERNMRASGVDPSEVGALEAQRKMAGEEALAEGYAVNQAARQADQDVTAGRFKVAEMGGRIFGRGLQAYDRGYGGLADQVALTQGQRNALQNETAAMFGGAAKTAESMKDVGKIWGKAAEAGAPPPYLDPNTAPYRIPGEDLVSYDPRRGYSMDVEGAFMGGVPYGRADGGMSPAGGAVNGPGGPVDDQIPANLPPNSYVIPADVVEALGVEYFDKIEMQNSGQTGQQGVQGRTNALLSNGEYVISPQTVQRKGKKFFDDLIAKYHKPAREQSEEYQQENQGAEPGEADVQFGGQQFAEGGQMGYFGRYDPMQRTQVGAQPAAPAPAPQPEGSSRFAELQKMWEIEQAGGQQMSMEDLMEYNQLLEQQKKADGGVQEYDDGGYLSGNMGASEGLGQYTSEFGKDQSDYFTKPFEFGGQTYGGYDREAAMAAANPQWKRVGKNTYTKAASEAPEIGVFAASPELMTPENRIALWKAKRAQRLGQRQQEADLEAYTPIEAQTYKRKKKSGLGKVISGAMRLGDPLNLTQFAFGGLKNPYASKRPGAAQTNPLAADISTLADGGDFDPEGEGYDYETATKHGMTPPPGEHWPSREPETEQVLKGRRHETFGKAVAEDRKLGYSITKSPDGKYYSTRDSAGGPTEGEIRRMPPETRPTDDGRDNPLADGGPSPAKAREMLSHGEVRGHPLTDKQRGLFGSIASRGASKSTTGAGARADGGYTSPPKEIEFDPMVEHPEVERIANKYKKKTTEKKADGGSVTVEEEFSFVPKKKKTRRGGRRHKKLGKFGK